ncbi:MAG: hypothetical protein JSV29_09250 [Candidatus Bathyarchaeota archaeon]|nr:MAG: hypothetical protein JSV29_09250 [Candidatus Bathyarchaeota archaeon]
MTSRVKEVVMKRTYGITIVFLVAGLVVGYVVGFGVYQPQISGLQGNVSGLNDQITDLQGQISALEANVTHLESWTSACTWMTSVQEICEDPESFYDYRVYVRGCILSNLVMSGYGYYLYDLGSDPDISPRVPLVPAEGLFNESEMQPYVRYEFRKDVGNFVVEEINDVNVGITGVVRYKRVPDDLWFRLEIEKIEALCARIDWTCSLRFHNETFIVTLDVNLADGMNRDEAVKVATRVFNVTIGHGTHHFRSAKEDEKGIWTIELTWGYSIQDLGHWFEAVIDPFNQTVVYDRCK